MSLGREPGDMCLAWSAALSREKPRTWSSSTYGEHTPSGAAVYAEIGHRPRQSCCGEVIPSDPAVEKFQRRPSTGVKVHHRPVERIIKEAL